MRMAVKAVVGAMVGIALCAIFAGCGVTSKKLNDAEKRIAALVQQGMPDSLLTDVRVLLVQVTTSKKYGGGGASPEKLYDSAMTLLANAEKNHANVANQLKPQVEALRNTFDARKQALTGPQLQEADSLIKLADSCIKQNKWSEAKEKCVMIDAALNSLAQDEKNAKEVKAKLPGTWIGSQKVKNKEAKADFVEKKTFTFTPDGKVDIIEERNGQTNEALKEDWKFLSGGTYSLKGDTIMIAITKEKCLKQIFTNLVEKGGKPQWVKNQKPAYDSTITSGKKDRFIAFSYLKEVSKKK